MNISFDELITKLRNPLTIKEWSHFTEGKTINPEIWTQVNKEGTNLLMIALKYQTNPDIIKEVLSHVSTLENVQKIREQADNYGWDTLSNPSEFDIAYKNMEKALSQIDKLEYHTQKEIWKHYRDWRPYSQSGENIAHEKFQRLSQNFQPG